MLFKPVGSCLKPTTRSLHLVWATKNREPQLTHDIRSRLFPHICETAARKGFSIDTINGRADHFHILLCLNPKLAVSSVVKHIKGGSLRWLNELALTEGWFQWQDGFSAFSASNSVIPRVRINIQEQEIRHNKLSFEEEMKLFQKPI